MFYSRTSTNMINKVNEWALRVVLNDHTSDFEILLQRNNDVYNQHGNIQTLLIKIFKTKNGLVLHIMGSMFKMRNTTCNLKNFQEFETGRKRAVYFGLETLSYRSSQLWSPLPEHMKQINSLDQFRRIVRQWVCNTCPWRFCKVYLQSVGFWRQEIFCKQPNLAKKLRFKCWFVKFYKTSTGFLVSIKVFMSTFLHVSWIWASFLVVFGCFCS